MLAKFAAWRPFNKKISELLSEHAPEDNSIKGFAFERKKSECGLDFKPSSWLRQKANDVPIEWQFTQTPFSANYLNYKS